MVMYHTVNILGARVCQRGHDPQVEDPCSRMKAVMAVSFPLFRLPFSAL